MFFLIRESLLYFITTHSKQDIRLHAHWSVHHGPNSCEVGNFLHLPFLLLTGWAQVLSIPRPKSIPRSKSTPRSKSKPRYPLYSSLMFHCSQSPISITAKHPCQFMIPLIFHPQPKHCSPLIHYVMLLQAMMRWPHSAFQVHTPWQLVVTHSRRLTTHHHFSFIPYPFLLPVSTSLTLTVNPRSCGLSVLDYYLFVDSLV